MRVDRCQLHMLFARVLEIGLTVGSDEVVVVICRPLRTILTIAALATDRRDTKASIIHNHCQYTQFINKQNKCHLKCH